MFHLIRKENILKLKNETLWSVASFVWLVCVFQAEFNNKNTFYVFNHVDIKISYHSGESESWRGARLVGATLEPKR